jgi:hypothetical protein
VLLSLSVEAACARQVTPWLSLSLSLPLSPSPLLLPVLPSPSIGKRAHAERDRERGQLPGMSSQRRRPPCALPLIGRCSVAWPGLVLLPARPARPGHSRDARRPMALARPPVDRISRPVLRTVQGYGGGVARRAGFYFPTDNGNRRAPVPIYRTGLTVTGRNRLNSNPNSKAPVQPVLTSLLVGLTGLSVGLTGLNSNPNSKAPVQPVYRPV